MLDRHRHRMTRKRTIVEGFESTREQQSEVSKRIESEGTQTDIDGLSWTNIDGEANSGTREHQLGCTEGK